MKLGAFSVSLAVKDVVASQAFYEQFGFHDVVIGLFAGMFERNTLTFNPGWNAGASPVEEFTDVRELQRRLKARVSI